MFGRWKSKSHIQTLRWPYSHLLRKQSKQSKQRQMFTWTKSILEL